MDPDEGPYRQSERAERYQVAVDALWDGRFLYACDCTREEVEARTKDNADPRLRRLLPGPRSGPVGPAAPAGRCGSGRPTTG